MRRMRVAALVTLALSLIAAEARSQGLHRGNLVISGGAPTTSEILDRFIRLAGGADAAIVVVPTSGDRPEYGDDCPCLEPFRRAGARHVTVLHTRDRAVANSPAFVEPLRRANGVWLEEGNAWRHQEAYLDTRVHQELLALLERGGVIGGGSAGARIQGEYLPLRSTEPSTRALPEKDWRRGFALLPRTIIDPHVLVRNRQFDLIAMVRAHPEMLGIGIDENTAIVVHGDSFEVIGSSYVIIYDDRRQLVPEGQGSPQADAGLFYFLRRGDRYNLTTREPERPGAGRQPFARIIERPWPER